MSTSEIDNLEQKQFWERFRLYKRISIRKKAKEVRRWAAIYNRYNHTDLLVPVSHLLPILALPEIILFGLPITFVEIFTR